MTPTRRGDGSNQGDSSGGGEKCQILNISEIELAGFAGVLSMGCEETEEPRMTL